MRVVNFATCSLIALLICGPLTVCGQDSEDSAVSEDDVTAVSPSDINSQGWSLFDNSERSTQITGWMQLGYHNASNGGFNSHPDNFNLHQLWFALDRAPEDDGVGLNLGYHMDIVYGVDAPNVQSFGNNAGNYDFQNGLDHGSYAWALPQLYGSATVGSLDLKVGHFSTLVGYEQAAAPANFFYSHSMGFNNTAPRTHTGVLATTEARGAEVYLGWTLGWDTGFDQLGSGSAALGGFSKQIGDRTRVSYITTFGDLGHRGVGYTHSMVVEVAFGDQLTYIAQHDFANVSSSTDSTDDVGINNYLIYDLNDTWSLGGRLEWWRNDTTSRYSAGAGLNWNGRTNLTVRPEVRLDWSPETDEEVTIFAVDAIIAF